MSDDRDITSPDAHFAFGANWRSYAEVFDENDLREAIAGLRRLLDSATLVGGRVLDIGCESGVHSIAASMLGAEPVFGVDIDPKSVEAATVLQQKFTPKRGVHFEVASVFDQRDVDQRLIRLGFVAERRWVKSGVMSRVGVLGSGCDEYVFRRR